MIRNDINLFINIISMWTTVNDDPHEIPLRTVGRSLLVYVGSLYSVPREIITVSRM